jgi:hypothetical protein
VARRRACRPAILVRRVPPVRGRAAPGCRHRRRRRCNRRGAGGRHGELCRLRARLGQEPDDHDRRRLRRHADAPRWAHRRGGRLRRRGRRRGGGGRLGHAGGGAAARAPRDSRGGGTGGVPRSARVPAARGVLPGACGGRASGGRAGARTGGSGARRRAACVRARPRRPWGRGADNAAGTAGAAGRAAGYATCPGVVRIGRPARRRGSDRSFGARTGRTGRARRAGRAPPACADARARSAGGRSRVVHRRHPAHRCVDAARRGAGGALARPPITGAARPSRSRARGGSRAAGRVERPRAGDVGACADTEPGRANRESSESSPGPRLRGDPRRLHACAARRRCAGRRAPGAPKARPYHGTR